MVYLHVTLKVYYGRTERFYEIMSHLVPVLEGLGWKLAGAWENAIGRLNTVVDLWELPDANSVQSTLAEANKNPEFAEWVTKLGECLEEEVLQIMTKVPYSR